MIAGFLTHIFARVRLPDRFFRFRRTALAISFASWLPWGAGLVIGYDAIKQPAQKSATIHPAVLREPDEAPAHTRRLGLAFLLVAGSQAVGYPAWGYYLLARRRRILRPPL
ncbi:MAG: hypothetical protein H6865_00540 [Rhodospirillales bacterium]|nr:hypothetical protein [Alphaproteobacteria bacterium]MCB9986114.1 hypothetical protein [Rhodospirillales bacterium]USO07326.1 MAG: hypothetical protein H6866_07835 [Rhodospirillales bacterium]